MREKWNWFFTLWRREWDYWEKQLVKQLRLELICIGIVFVLFVMSGKLIEPFSAYIASMPDAVKAFWGLWGSVDGRSPLFYMKWILMPLHVWIAWEACNRAMKTVWREEERGNIYALCNQWYDRSQIGVAKYVWVVLSFILKYAVMFLVFICLALVACSRGQRLSELKILLSLMGKGILVISFLIALSTTHAMLHTRRDRSVWADALILGTLLLGNLYKVRELLNLSMRQSGRDFARLISLLGWTNLFKGLAPLSWLNPFAEYSKVISILHIAVCTVGVAVAAVIGIRGYRVRKFV